jgi:hypothetical protein
MTAMQSFMSGTLLGRTTACQVRSRRSRTDAARGGRALWARRRPGAGIARGGPMIAEVSRRH